MLIFDYLPGPSSATYTLLFDFIIAVLLTWSEGGYAGKGFMIIYPILINWPKC